jgi:hypothetical protein
MKFEVMRTFILKNKVNIFISGWSEKPQISYFEWPPTPLAVVFGIFRKIHFHP